MALFTMTSTTVESDRRLRSVTAAQSANLKPPLCVDCPDAPLFCTIIVGATEMAKSVTKDQETKKLLE
jgi:hypothetical protein